MAKQTTTLVAAAGTELEPCEPSSIAVAVRRFGDAYPLHVPQRHVRLAAFLLVVVTCFYIQWMWSSLNPAAPWIAWPFAVTNSLSVLYALVMVCNQWQREVPPPRLLEHGLEPLVAVIIPTCGEPTRMILRTVQSVFEQDYPHERLIVIVSDDGHDAVLQRRLSQLFPAAVYHDPVERWSPGRDGAAKAGNLNCAVALVNSRFADVEFIETRDADDEVGSLTFLRATIGQLRADDRLAYVQTIKEAQVSNGDPFNNRESMFYRGQMLTRNAANAVFPCGSGVVWRREALDDIGGFPTWNLVEDLQSGVEALRRGWRGCYLPIVGAVGQHSPEDLPNVYKQRGTWAIDTVRLMVWGNLRGLGLRQRLHFYGMLFDYLHAFAIMAYLPCLAMSLLGFTPFQASGGSYLLHVLPMVAATEIWLLAANRPFNDRRGRQRHPYLDLWRSRIMWTGLAPVYAKAALQAVFSGPHRKPVYKVTRKEDDLRWHWQHTTPQAIPVMIVTIITIYAIVHHTLPNLMLLSASIYWGVLNLLLLVGFVTRGWHGLRRLP
jgi:cellulose synthase (UDP-forming)